MKRMFLLFVVSVFCCLLFPAVAQERLYMVTETELIRLESISENLKISRQNLLLQASNLTERLRAQESKAKSLTEKLQTAESTANILRSQLQTERASLKALRQSYNTYEKEASETIAKQQAIINKQKDKLHRRMIAVIILSAILTILLFTIGVKYFLKYKFSLFRPP
nr:MAG TPA: SECRETED 45 KDA PROTEIN CYCLE, PEPTIDOGLYCAN, CHAP, CELL [Caudoviricetes sp.]